MKYSYTLLVGSLLLFGLQAGFAQQSALTYAEDVVFSKDIVYSPEITPVKKYTIMERFEPEYALTAAKRKQMKAERFEKLKAQIEIIDAMDVSEQKREHLLQDLLNKPFSQRLTKALADTKFEEEVQ